MTKKEIHSLSGLQIVYSGYELRQEDEDVYLSLLHLARNHELGTSVHFSGYSILAELNWDASGKAYARLVDCIERLQHTSISIDWNDANGTKFHYTGSLVSSFAYGERVGLGPGNREWQIQLDPKVVTLFGPTDFTRVDWGTRLKLTPMSKWLHSFYQTHENPYHYKVETIRDLMGSKIKELKGFRYKLRIALGELKDVGFFREAQIDARSDMVIVSRTERVRIAQ